MAIATTDPRTGAVLKTFDDLTPDQLEDTLSRAAAAAASYRLTTYEQRAGWLSAAADVLDGTGSANGALRRAGYVIHGARRVIHATHAPEDVAGHLGVEPGDPVLRIRSLSWDQSDRRFDYYETWVLTDTVPLEVNIVAS